MDITPQVINEVEFPLKVRGYDPDEVDDFLERMAVGVGQMQERLEQLGERAQLAERRAAELDKRLREGGGERPAAAQPAMTPAQETEQLSRTLAMAQRFVDQAMKEAQEEADHLVAEANDRAKRLHTETDVEIERMRNEAQAEIADEVRQLEAARASLQGDVEALTRHADDQRGRLRASLAAFEHLLDDPEGLRTTTGPELSEGGLPDFARNRTSGRAAESDGAGGAAPTEGGERPAQTGGGGTPEAAAPDGGDESANDDREPERLRSVPPPSASSDVAAATPPTTARRRPARAADDNDDEAWARFAQGPEPLEEGPPTAVHLVEGGGDPYLSELKRAMGEGPAGGATDAVPAPGGPFDQDDDPRPKRRFERR
jgi:DivIVA domain-containing protein